MEKLDKKSNNELISLRKDLKDNFEIVKIDVLKIYDYWKSIEEDYHKVNNELKKRGI